MKPRRSSSFLFALTFMASSVLDAQPYLVHLSLQSTSSPDATAPVTVTWCSDNTGGKQYVKYGLTADPGKKMKAFKNEFNGKALFNADLKKLKPGTKYF
jgi:membrane protein YqaA with SNARE-associated domain